MSALATQTTAAPASPAPAAAATTQPTADASITTATAAPAAITTEAKPEPAAFLGGLATEPAGNTAQSGAAPEGAKPTDAAPFDIKLPEGVDIDKGFLEGFKTAAQAQKLTPEAASGLAAWYADNYKKAVEENAKAVAKQGEDWKAALKADPEFGGQKLTESAQAAQKAWQRFGGEKLLGEIRTLGLEYHPGLTKMMAAIGKAMAEDNSAGGARPPQPTDAESLHRQLYPTMFENAPG